MNGIQNSKHSVKIDFCCNFIKIYLLIFSEIENSNLAVIQSSHVFLVYVRSHRLVIKHDVHYPTSKHPIIIDISIILNPFVHDGAATLSEAFAVHDACAVLIKIGLSHQHAREG